MTDVDPYALLDAGKHPTGFPTLDNTIAHPDYLPPGKREKFLAALRAWVQANSDPATWPKWLRQFWTESKIRQMQAAKRAQEAA